jgi:hypothetical protein
MPKSSLARGVSRSLTLPDGYQHWYPGKWFNEHEEPNEYRNTVNSVQGLKEELATDADVTLYLYTQHEIFYEGDVIKQTRSSPNWEGGMVTYATCKHFMRSWDREWEGVWIAGLCPGHCNSNCLLFAGKVKKVFTSNYALRRYVKINHKEVYNIKLAKNNPRGDLYTPTHTPLNPEEKHLHTEFLEPPNHTRSLEYYKKSPGSASEREDGKIPKWWRDIEYDRNGNKPKSFILSPCYLFSKPQVWSTYEPKRATLKLTTGALKQSLQDSPK